MVGLVMVAASRVEVAGPDVAAQLLAQLVGERRAVGVGHVGLDVGRAGHAGDEGLDLGGAEDVAHRGFGQRGVVGGADLLQFLDTLEGLGEPVAAEQGVRDRARLPPVVGLGVQCPMRLPESNGTRAI